MVEIRVSPERLFAIAHQLESQKIEIEVNIKQMMALVNNLSGEWTGMTQIDAVRIFDTELPLAQRRMSEIVECVSRELLRIAQVFQETDESVL